MKHVIIVNGKPKSGKDIFVDACRKYISDTDIGIVHNISSVTPIKEMLENYFYWDGTKSDVWRNMIAEIKRLWINACNGPTKYLFNTIYTIDESSYGDAYIFVMIREPDEILKLVELINTINIVMDVDVTTLYIDRCSVNDIEYGNKSDMDVRSYEYDIYICNDDGLDELNTEAIKFINMKFGGNKDGEQ